MKKFTALILCLLMIVTFSFAGCATFSIDPVKYYNEIVAEVGNTKIKRYELVNAYNSYGYTYFVVQQNKTEQEAMQETVTLLANREALYQYALKHKDIYQPTTYEMNELIKTMFDSIDGQLDEYLATAKNIYNVKDKATDPAAESSTTSNKSIMDYYYNYNGIIDGETYQSKRRATVEKVNVYYTDETKETRSPNNAPTEYFEEEYRLKYTYTKPTEIVDYTLGEDNKDYLSNYETEGVNLLINVYFEDYENELAQDYGKTTAANLMAKVKSILVDNLLDYEYYLRDDNNKPYSTKTDDLIYRYFERTFNSQIKSQYLTNIRTKYLADADYLNVNALISRLKRLTQDSHDDYSSPNRANLYKKDIMNIGTNGDTIYYHPSTGNIKYGYFVHTLLSFSESQQTALGNITDKNSAEYNSQINNTKVMERDLFGNEIGEKSLVDVLTEYAEFANDSTTSSQIKLQKFIEFMFKYTGDADSTLVPGMPYVVGFDSTINQADASDEDLQKYSTMAREFTIEASNLMKAGLSNNTTGNMSKIELDNGKAKLNYSNMCITTYGIHLLYYVGEVDAFDVDYGKLTNNPSYDNYYIGLEEDNNPNNLTNKIINPLTNETYLDRLFDLVYPATSDTETYSSNNGYSQFESNAINEIKYVAYDDKINATKPSI